MSGNDISGLSPQEKRRLLEQLLRERTEFYPLSYAQRGMWFVHQLAPQAAAYNTGFASRILSEVDITALESAFQFLVERHTALRTTFVTRNGRLRQWIHRESAFALLHEDASGWSDPCLRLRVQEACAQPFDLETGPLLRVVIFTRGPSDHVLLLVVHHIVFDGWSFWILFDELRACYEAARLGIMPGLPPLRTAYTDFVDWEARMVAAPQGDAHRGYWEKQLAGDLPVLAFPNARPSEQQSFEGDVSALQIAPPVTYAIRELARCEGVTLYTVLLAAFQIFLYLYTRQEDVVVGSPTTGRSRPEFSGVVGDFVNMVALRARVSGDMSFREFLRNANLVLLHALEHQDYPFSLLVEKLNCGWNRNHAPVFQASFVFHKAQRSDRLMALLDAEDPDIRVDWGGLVLSPYPIRQQSGQFDLTLEIADRGDRLTGALKYRTALFDPASARKMAEDFVALIEGILADPSRCLANLPLPQVPDLTAGPPHRDLFLL